MLLMNLKAHTPALTLLANLPFEKSEIKADELEIRAVLRAAYDGTRLGPRAPHTFSPPRLTSLSSLYCRYRLLKAMCTDFPLMQTELVASIPLFVDHTEANLVSYDITPTGCDGTRLSDRAPSTHSSIAHLPLLPLQVHQRVLQGQPDGVRAGDRGHRPPVRAAGGAGEGAALPPLPPHDHDAQRPGDQAPLDLTSYCHSSHLSSPPTSLCR